MRALVLDASAVVEYLLRTSRGVPIEAALRSSPGVADVPALCDVEVASVLRRAVLAGWLTPGRAGEALADYRDLPLTRHGHLALLDRALALRDNFSAYDATYVALAERLEATAMPPAGRNHHAFQPEPQGVGDPRRRGHPGPGHPSHPLRRRSAPAPPRTSVRTWAATGPRSCAA